MASIARPLSGRSGVRLRGLWAEERQRCIQIWKQASPALLFWRLNVKMSNHAWRRVGV